MICTLKESLILLISDGVDKNPLPKKFKPPVIDPLQKFLQSHGLCSIVQKEIQISCQSL